MTVAAKKSLGQNFLVDQNVLRRIAEAISPQQGEHIIEIGPGTGALTRHLLATGAHVTALEKDPRMAPPLTELAAQHPQGKLDLRTVDALTVDFSTLTATPAKMVGNLPYNVGTEIIFRALETPPLFTTMVFMLQKEVVARITAHPGGKDWGRLGLWCQWLCETRHLFDVPPGAFRPRPKVTSAIVQLTPKPAPFPAANPEILRKISMTAFGQRRKMLRASLRSIFCEEDFQKVGINPQRRPETLSLKEFCALANVLENQ